MVPAETVGVWNEDPKLSNPSLFLVLSVGPMPGCLVRHESGKGAPDSGVPTRDSRVRPQARQLDPIL